VGKDPAGSNRTDAISILEDSVNAAQYATHVGKSERTVLRWLKAGELPAATKTPDGQWFIPADAVHQVTSPDVSVTRQVTRQDDVARVNLEGPTLSEYLDRQPALLSLEEASRLLGVPESTIVRHRERFAVEELGRAISTWRVPGRIVREIAGL
jgi:hypothetical protein